MRWPGAAVLGVAVQLVFRAVPLSTVGALVGFHAEVHRSVVGAEVVAPLERPLAETAHVSGSVGHVALVHVPLVALRRPELRAAYFALLYDHSAAAGGLLPTAARLDLRRLLDGLFRDGRLGQLDLHLVHHRGRRHLDRQRRETTTCSTM